RELPQRAPVPGAKAAVLELPDLLEHRAHLDERAVLDRVVDEFGVVEREHVLARRPLEVVAVAPEADQLPPRVALNLVEELVHGVAAGAPHVAEDEGYIPQPPQ